jgi:hypothetical protein
MAEYQAKVRARARENADAVALSVVSVALLGALLVVLYRLHF